MPSPPGSDQSYQYGFSVAFPNQYLSWASDFNAVIRCFLMSCCLAWLLFSTSYPEKQKKHRSPYLNLRQKKILFLQIILQEVNTFLTDMRQNCIWHLQITLTCDHTTDSHPAPRWLWRHIHQSKQQNTPPNGPVGRPHAHFCPSNPTPHFLIAQKRGWFHSEGIHSQILHSITAITPPPHGLNCI